MAMMLSRLQRFLWLGCLFLTVRSSGQAKDDSSPLLPAEFLDACTQGDAEYVQTQLNDHSEWAHGRSSQGETCLHVAGILGQAKVTELVLKAGGNPNVRTTFEQGLRMHPLSWNVYGGHVETAKILLENGALVNLDFDSMGSQPRKVTCMDILLDILESDPKAEDPHMEKYRRMKTLLLEHGAKRFEEISNAKKL